MPTFEFTAPDGKSYEVGAPEGATQAQAFEMLQGQIAAGAAPAASQPSGTVSTGRTLNDFGRQLGLTARAALTGPAEAAQIVTEPVRRIVTDPLLQAIGGRPTGSRPLGEYADQFADVIGLPRPENPLERTVQTGARMGFGAGGLAKLAGAAGSLLSATTAAEPLPLLTPAASSLARFAPNQAATAGALQGLAANPALQIGSAAGSGLAGGASREAGGSPLQQTVASVAGGLGGAGTVAGAQAVGRGVQAGAQGLRNLLNPAAVQQSIDLKLTNTLANKGVDFGALPSAAQTALRREYQQAMRTGGMIDETALGRLADFSAVGATPTRGMISQDPVQITREMNLAKQAANMSGGELAGLPRMQNQNNQVLIARMNDLGADRGTLPVDAGRALAGSIEARAAAKRATEQAAWDVAKNSPGYKQPIYPDALNAINSKLGDDALMPFMSPQISKYMEAFQNGSQPFTPQHYKNLRSMLSNETMKGGNEAAAAKAAIKALDATPMRPITNPGGVDFGAAPVTPGLAAAMRAKDAQTPDAIAAIDRARRATREAYAYEESSPLVKRALSSTDAADPTKLAEAYIIRGTPDQARQAVQEMGNNKGTARDSLIAWIKNQSLSGAADETGKVSQAAMNRALNKIGDEKLSLFFTPDEVTKMRQLGRVASLMQVQPIGSAVNNSNSGALLLGRGLDFLSMAAKKIPGGQAFVADPIQDWRLSVGQRAAQNVGPALIARPPGPPVPRGSPLLLPGLAAGGAALGSGQ